MQGGGRHLANSPAPLQTLQAELFAAGTAIPTARPRKGTDLPACKMHPVLRLFGKGKVNWPFSRARAGLGVGLLSQRAGEDTCAGARCHRGVTGGLNCFAGSAQNK